MPEQILAIDDLISTTGEPTDLTIGWLTEQRRATCRRIAELDRRAQRHLTRRAPAAGDAAIAAVDVLCASLAEASELRAALQARIDAICAARADGRRRR
ncbi:MAG TPA: hypothetical protein VKB80_26735 [Kofleriaceae bacterium]|nr:hypothetical protein [Kofleriaceae bacterium]